MPLCSDRFSFSMSSTVLIANASYEVGFLPLVTAPRIGTSTVTVRTGFDTIIMLIRLILFTQPLRFFLPISFFLFVSGVLWALPFLMLHRGVSVGALFLALTGLLTALLGALADIGAQLLRNQNP